MPRKMPRQPKPQDDDYVPTPEEEEQATQNLLKFYREVEAMLIAKNRIPANGKMRFCMHRLDGKPEIEAEWKNPNLTNERRAAFYLRTAMVHSRSCPDKTCRRIGICQRPPLMCELRPVADVYDWDRGWWFSKRRDIYGAKGDDYMPGVPGGPPEKREAEMQEWRDIRDTVKMKM
jgi:hypothetical protein